MSELCAVMDVECYKNYFLIAFLNTKTNSRKYFEQYDGFTLDVAAVRKILNTYKIVTFNGQNYDLPQVFHALTGADCAKLKASNDFIIGEGRKFWQVEARFGFKISSKINHIDIFELLPLKASLKTYGGRIHTKSLVDLPFDPSALISPEERETLRNYCFNDTIITKELYEKLSPQLELRARMSEVYNTNLLSKSDAAIAETIIKLEVERATKNKVEKPTVKEYSFRYKKPDFIKFTTPLLQDVLDTVLKADFNVLSTGKVKMPEEIGNAEITIGSSTYSCGIGGLHSQEANVAHFIKEGLVLRDVDCTAFYPSIIIQTGLYPPTMGKTFSSVYKSVVDRRNAAKASGDTVTADSLKITANSSYGKLSNQYSSLYAPELSIQVVMTGQLSLLMLIERMENVGVSVISANTDGIVLMYEKDVTLAVETQMRLWEKQTGFTLEDTFYRALYQSSVNAYIALKSPTGVKLKGAYAPSGLQKNPTNEICVEAVVKYLDKGIDIVKTISECKDIRKFVTIRTVKGGAVKDGVYLGRICRWYYSRLAFGDIKYKINGYTVPRSEGAEPCMVLPDEFPCDVNIKWYIDEAYKILKEVGV